MEIKAAFLSSYMEVSKRRLCGGTWYLSIPYAEGLLPQWFHLLHIDFPEQDGTQYHGGNLSQGDGIPYGMESECPGKEVGQREDTYQLSGDGYNQAVYAVAHGLEDRTHDDAVACKEEAEAYDPEGRYSDGQHVRVRLEQLKQLGRHKLEYGQADEHDKNCDTDTQADGFHDTLFVTGAVIVSNNRNHTVVQTEYGHEDKALKLEIYAKNGYGCFREADKDFIQSKGHDGTDGLHYNGRNTHLIDDGNGPAVWGKSFEADAHILVFCMVQDGG